MKRTTRAPGEPSKDSSPALVLLAAAALAACGSSTEASGPAEPVVAGACLEAATGEVLAGVLVRGPGGLEVRSDEQGRFVLRGLRVGEAGWLRAESEDGLVAELPLAPLEPGTLEVVFHLREAGE